MKKENRSLAYGYVRLSKDEIRSVPHTNNSGGSRDVVRSSQPEESESITNQKNIIATYCAQHNIILLKIYSDDGWSGGNFDRPGFIEMVNEINLGNANLIITKDLSRLGRDMAEASYYAERYFPEHGIRYIAIADNFDSERENIMAPFQFAMNEVYLRENSRKIREVFRMKMENGDYCICPPYGYNKAPNNKNRLVPDERTAGVVKRIFEYAASGRAAHWIAEKLTEEGIQSPLQNKIMYHGTYDIEAYEKANSCWNGTTINRMLRNRVYLGSTYLGKTKKVSFKSPKTIILDESDWYITEGTHEPLVSELLYERANANIGRLAAVHAKKEYRKNIFAGIAYCGECGLMMTCHCAAGGKYAYLVCSDVHAKNSTGCRTRIKYEQLLEIVKNELNQLISLNDSEIEALVRAAVANNGQDEDTQEKMRQAEKARAKLATIEKTVLKLYMDNASGFLSDERLREMILALDNDSKKLKDIVSLSEKLTMSNEDVERRYRKFFDRVKNHALIEELDRDTVVTFIERITIKKKKYETEYKYNQNRRASPFVQSLHISYKFAGEIYAIPDITEKDRLPINR